MFITRCKNLTNIAKLVKVRIIIYSVFSYIYDGTSYCAERSVGNYACITIVLKVVLLKIKWFIVIPFCLLSLYDELVAC